MVDHELSERMLALMHILILFSCGLMFTSLYSIYCITGPETATIIGYDHEWCGSSSGTLIGSYKNDSFIIDINTCHSNTYLSTIYPINSTINVYTFSGGGHGSSEGFEEFVDFVLGLLWIGLAMLCVTIVVFLTDIPREIWKCTTPEECIKLEESHKIHYV